MLKENQHITKKNNTPTEITKKIQSVIRSGFLN